MISELKLGKRFYEFYGTANDWYILNFNDCFPNIKPNNLNNDNFQVSISRFKIWLCSC